MLAGIEKPEPVPPSCAAVIVNTDGNLTPLPPHPLTSVIPVTTPDVIVAFTTGKTPGAVQLESDIVTLLQVPEPPLR